LPRSSTSGSWTFARILTFPTARRTSPWAGAQTTSLRPIPELKKQVRRPGGLSVVGCWLLGAPALRIPRLPPPSSGARLPARHGCYATPANI
jgi:hypothetical protein